MPVIPALWEAKAGRSPRARFLVMMDQQNRAHSNLDWTTDIGDAISLFYYVAKKSDTFFTPVHPASEI